VVPDRGHFSRAQDLEPAGRESFVIAACHGDTAVSAEVLSLLAHDARLGPAVLNTALDAIVTPGIAPPDGNDAAPGHDVTAVDDYIGLTLKDRYVLERELGRGGAGVVYVASDRLLPHKRWVVKLLNDGAVDREAFRRTFQKEIKALSLLDAHERVVTVSDAGELPHTRQPYFVMDYVEGTTLKSLILKRTLDVARVVEIVRQIGDALTAAHATGIYHLDLKPGNIMVQEVGTRLRVWLIDFGAARIISSEPRPSPEVTVFIGTPEYMAPEQFERRPCAASDTYALGVIAFEMLTGHRPAEDYQFPYPLSPATQRVLGQALAFDPSRRPRVPLALRKTWVARLSPPRIGERFGLGTYC